MDFTLSEEQEALQATVRRFARERLAPHAAEWDRERRGPPEEIERQIVEIGLCGICLPEEYGGGGQGLLEAVLAIEELARVSPSCAMQVFETNVGPVRIVERHGSEALRERWLPRVCEGAMIAASMTEAEAGSALTDLRTAASGPDGARALRGEKIFCSGAGVADAYLVYARLADEPGGRGIGAVLLERGREGLSFGAREEYMGLRGMVGGSVYLDDVPFTDDDVVVGPGGFAELMGGFNIERIGNATMSLAIARAALEDALAYAGEREAFGRPLCDFQAVQLLLADMHLRVDAARLLIYRAAANAGRGAPSMLEASTAKCFANQIGKEVADMAMQVFGGHGYTTSHHVERYLRDSYGWPVAGGTLQMQKVNIASALVGRRFRQRPEPPPRQGRS